MVLCYQAYPGLRRPSRAPGNQTFLVRVQGGGMLRVEVIKSLGSYSVGQTVQVPCFPGRRRNSEFCIEESQYLCCYFLWLELIFHRSVSYPGNQTGWRLHCQCLCLPGKVTVCPAMRWQISPLSNFLLALLRRITVFWDMNRRS